MRLHAPLMNQTSPDTAIDDFVVSTTQASFNSGLKEFLNETIQPTLDICFLTDDDRTINDQLTLTEFKELSGGVDPFKISHGTD